MRKDLPWNFTGASFEAGEEYTAHLRTHGAAVDGWFVHAVALG